MFNHMFGYSSLTVLIFLGVLYFVPAIVARQRKHPNATPIAVLNFFLGWTILGWVGALVWALMNPAHKPAGYVGVQGTPVQSGIDKQI